MESSLLKRVLRRLRRTAGPLDPASAYDLLASGYDEQRTNPLLVIDEELFGTLLLRIPLKGKSIVDVGCGTGRHWKTLLAQKPARLIGYDASPAMLVRLSHKHPQARVHVTEDHRLPLLADGSCDIVVSTLALTYFESPDKVFHEWSRVLKPAGDIIVTDLHPRIGGDGKFQHDGATITVRHHIHKLESLTKSAAGHGFRLLHLEERTLDDSLKQLYEAARALPLFLATRGLPIMYGLHFQKRQDR